MTREAWLRLLIIAAAIAALQAACTANLLPPTAVIAPSAMVRSLAALLASGQYDADIIRSLGEILAAAVLSTVLGFTAGVLIHAWPGLRAALQPWLASYYAVPTFILYPLFITAFGVGPASIIAMAVALAAVAMVEATLLALDNIPPVLRKTARIQRLGPAATILRIILPASLPRLFTGVKLAAAYAVIGVIASEFILSGAGLGYAIAYAYNNFDTRTMYALILLVVLAVTIFNALLDMADGRLNRGTPAP